MKELADCMYATLTLVSGTLTCRSACVGLGISVYLSGSDEHRRDEFTSAGGNADRDELLPAGRGGADLDGTAIGVGDQRVPGRDDATGDHVGDPGEPDRCGLTGLLWLVLHDADDDVAGGRGET